LISGGFQAQTGAEPPWKDKKNLSPPRQIPEYAPDTNDNIIQNQS